MANRFWVGGNGNWNDTGHWSTSSGGASGASVPGNTDAAIVDNNSGSPTIDTNNQLITVQSLTAGNPSATSPQASKTVIFKLTYSGFGGGLGIGSGGITLYGNVDFQYSDYSHVYIQIAAGTPTFTCYTNATLPFVECSGATTVTLAGSHFYLPRLRIFGTKVIYGSGLTIWAGGIDISGNGQIDMAGNGMTITGQLVDPTFTGAPTLGITLTTGTTPIINPGFINIGTLTDQAGTSWGRNGTRSYVFEFGDVTGGGLTMDSITMNYGVASITGNNTIAQFSMGNHAGKVTFNGTNVFTIFADGYGTVLFPSGKTQDIYQWVNDTTPTKYQANMRSATPGSSATVRIWGTVYTTRTTFKDITVVHMVKKSQSNYDISNANSNTSVSSPQTGTGQVFAAAFSGVLDSAVFYLDYLTTAPTGTIEARLYSITGTPGSTAVPNTLLATSSAIQASDLLNGTKKAINFTFLAGARVAMTAATNYAITFVRVTPGGGGVRASVDTSSPTHAGNQANLVSGVWSASSTVDMVFEVFCYVVDTSPGIVSIGGVDGGNNSGIQFAPKFQKFYKYDVYTPPSAPYVASFIGTIPSTEIISEFGYSNEINNVAGELNIRRAVDPETVLYAGDTYVGYRNKVVVTCFSEFNPGGITVYTGFIAGWKPNLTGTDKYVDITVLSYGTELSQFLVINDPTVDVNYSQSGTPLSFTSTRVAVSFTTGSVSNLAALDLSAFGVPAGRNITVKIYKDNGSNTPDNTAVLKTIQIFMGGSTGFTHLWNYVLVGNGLVVSGTSKYWAVIDITTPVSGDTFDPGTIFTTNSYGGGNFAYWNGAAWVNTSTNGISNFASYSSNLATTVAYNTDIDTALRNILDNYSLQGGLLNSSPQYGSDVFGSLGQDIPTATFKYTFQSNTIQDALNQLIAQAGSDWYWYDDVANSAIGFRRKSNGIYQGSDMISFQMERDLIAFNMEFTLEPIVNDLLLIGGDTGGGVNLFREYINYASVAQFGRRQKVLNDSNITDTAVADAVGTAYIQKNGYNPTTRAPITIGDNYYYEPLHPGMMFSIYNANVSNTYQISRIDFGAAQAVVSAATVPTQVTNQTQENTNQIIQINAVGNPTAPTVVSV